MWPGSAGYSPNIMPPRTDYGWPQGEKSREMRVYDIELCRLIDAEITRRSIAFMERQS
jgi:hypothetical protein